MAANLIKKTKKKSQENQLCLYINICYIMAPGKIRQEQLWQIFHVHFCKRLEAAVQAQKRGYVHIVYDDPGTTVITTIQIPWNPLYVTPLTATAFACVKVNLLSINIVKVIAVNKKVINYTWSRQEWSLPLQ